MGSPWIPPIPGGKLTSKPARDLGPAVTFLLWCYDAVRRDGTIEFQIGEVAGYLDESYYTVQKWWAAARGGPWFTNVIDRGKQGFRVRMADSWLEWRAVKSSSNDDQVPDQASEDKKAPPAPSSNAGQIPDLVLEEEKIPDQPPVKSPSNRNEVPDQALEAPAYKEDHHDQESGERGARKRAVSRAPPTLDQLHEGVTAYKRLTGKRTVTPAVAAQIAESVTDMPHWEKVITAWCGKYRPENVSGMLDWYEHPEKMNSNGTHQAKRHANAPSRRSGHPPERLDGG